MSDAVQRLSSDCKEWSDADICNAPPEEISEEATFACRHLKHCDAQIRLDALDVLGRLAAAGFGAAAPGLQHAAASAVAKRLEDVEPEVRQAAADVLTALEPSELARHIAAVARQLEDSDDGVRYACVAALAKVAKNMGAITSQLDDSEEYLGYVYKAMFARLARRVEDPEAEVREAALEALSLLDPELLVRHAAAVTPALRDSEVSVRSATVRLLAKLEPTDLAEHNAAIAGVLQGGNSLLHYAAESGSLSLLKCLASKHRNTLLHAKNLAQDTPLHLAAHGGFIQICAHLQQLGALVKAKNTRGQTPSVVAEAAGHCAVVEYLDACDNLTTIRGGTGDALEPAMADMRPVVGLEWYTIAMPGLVGIVGGIHSLIAVTVGDLAGATHTYVIEKAALVRGDIVDDAERYMNGVHVSNWLDVVSNVDGHPIYTLELCDIANNTGDPDLCMRSLRDIAVRIGPYEVATCNCHHAALRMYNACAQVHAQVPNIPNEYLTWTAWMLRTAGLDIATSTSSRSGFGSNSVSAQSQGGYRPSSSAQQQKHDRRALLVPVDY